ncbi:DUF7373 family lipoprotein [Nocardia sp. IFM 10818]
MTPQFPDKARRLGLAALAAALLAACTVTGDPTPHYPDPSTLETGDYSAIPFETPSGSEAYGRILESVRMAEAMMDPAEADRTLTEPAGLSDIMPLPTPQKAAILLAQPVRAVLERHGMLAGVAVGASDRAGEQAPEPGRARVLTVIVLRFPDSDAAQRAAADIDAVDAAVSPDNIGVTIPDHPAARAHWRPSVPTLAATVAHDVYAISVIAGHTATDLTVLTGLARAAFAAQITRLRDFAPTPREQLATLPLDPHGMIRRTVPEAPGRWPYPAVVVHSQQLNAGWDSLISASGVAYGPRGAWLWGGRRNTDTPPDLLVYNGFNALHRFPSAAIARRWFAGTPARMADMSVRAVAAPAGVPDVWCWESPSPDFWSLTKYSCRVIYGRYVATVLARDLTNLHHKTAAQYGLLVNSE